MPVIIQYLLLFYDTCERKICLQNYQRFMAIFLREFQAGNAEFFYIVMLNLTAFFLF